MTQLRIYTINRGALQQFAKEWNDHIRPLREKLGVEILGAWTVTSTNQFARIMRMGRIRGKNVTRLTSIQANDRL